MRVTHPAVYTTPLDGIYRSSPSSLGDSVQKQHTPFDYHAFVVLKINSEIHVSVEKQIDGIYMSKSNNIDHVKYCFGKVPRKLPVEESIADDSDFAMHQLLTNIGDETGEYDLVTNNCKDLAQRIFGKVALHKHWDFKRPEKYFLLCFLYFIALVLCFCVLRFCYFLCNKLADWYIKYFVQEVVQEVIQEVVPQDFTNLFNDWRKYRDLPDDRLVEVLTSTPDISTFMLVELMNVFVHYKDHNKANYISKNISQICSSKSLSTAPHKFIHSFIKSDLLCKHLPQSVISDEDTIVAVSNVITAEQLLTSPQYYKLYLESPASNLCNRPGKCGFILKVTPFSEEDDTKFNIQLVTDDREYTQDIIHCHCDVLCAANMHLTVETCYSGVSYNRWVSWRGRPVYSEEYDLVE